MTRTPTITIKLSRTLLFLEPFWTFVLNFSELYNTVPTKPHSTGLAGVRKWLIREHTRFSRSSLGFCCSMTSQAPRPSAVLSCLVLFFNLSLGCWRCSSAAAAAPRAKCYLYFCQSASAALRWIKPPSPERRSSWRWHVLQVSFGKLS